MQTAIEWLIDKIVQDQMYKAISQKEWIDIFEQAKEMEKQQMQDFGARCCLMTKQKNEWTLEQYYNETYGSKGSDELGNSLEWNGEATEGYNIHTSSQTEISDKEIYKQADKEFRHFEDEDKDIWIRACQWYREQLKKKQ